MQIYYELKDMLHDELAEIVKKGELSAGSLETVDKLLNSIKNACKIVMYDEYSEDRHSYADGGSTGGYSNARGMNTKRDSMGRYARESGYSNARGGRGGRYSRNSGYSYAEDNEKVELLNEMLSDASNEEEKRIIHKLIHRLENE